MACTSCDGGILRRYLKSVDINAYTPDPSSLMVGLFRILIV